MKKIKIPALNGYIYVELYNGKKEEDDRAKIFDENKEYLDYISLDGRTRQEYNKIVDTIKNSQDIETFIEYISGLDRYDYSESLEYLIESLYDNGDTTQEEYDLVEQDIQELTEQELLEKYCINKVGDYYFYIGGDY